MTETFPPPNDPESFESLCLDLWKDIWQDPGAQQNGRSGQPQAGVDVYGRQDGKWMGVQCKQKDGLLRTKVTIGELEHEIAEALTFTPHLSAFTLATTGPADEKVQKRARQLTDTCGFPIEVWSWEKIWHEIYVRKHLLLSIGPVYWPRIWRLVEERLTLTHSLPFPLTRLENKLSTHDVTASATASQTFLTNLGRIESSVYRQDERKLAELIDGSHRVIVVHGLPGVGKTTLVQRVCQTLAKHQQTQGARSNEGDVLAGIVWTTSKETPLTFNHFCDLLADCLHAPALKRLSIKKKRHAMCQLLGHSYYLIVVDNFETVRDPHLKRFLNEIPTPSRVIETSREIPFFLVSSAVLFRLEPFVGLAPPDEEHHERAVTTKDDRIQFVMFHCARLGLPLNAESDYEAITSLMDTTGGLPLAICWVLGQVKESSRSIYDILSEVKECKGNSSELFAKSWNMLDVGARELLMALSALVPPVKLPELASVSGQSESRAADNIGQLAGISFVDAVGVFSKNPSYGCHPLVRSLAKHRLDGKSELRKAFLIRREAYYTHLLAKFGNRANYRKSEWLTKEDQNVICEAHENITAVLAWALDEERWDAIIDIIFVMVHYWGTKGNWNDRIYWVRHAIEAAHSTGDNKSRSILLSDGLGWVYMQREQFGAALSVMSEGLEVALQHNYPDEAAEASIELGLLARAQQRLEESVERLKHAVECDCHEAIKAAALYELGLTYYLNDKEKMAQECHSEPLVEKYRLLTHPGAEVLLVIGDLLVRKGDCIGAEAKYREQVQHSLMYEQRYSVPKAYFRLAILKERTDPEQAAEYCRIALEQFVSLGMFDVAARIQAFMVNMTRSTN